MAAPTLTARLYSLLFRRTSTFALTIAVGALFFERAFDQGADAIYEHINQGVRAWAIPDLGFLRGVTVGVEVGRDSVDLYKEGVNPGRLVSVDCRLCVTPGVNPKKLNEVNRSHYAGVLSIAACHATNPFLHLQKPKLKPGESKRLARVTPLGNQWRVKVGPRPLCLIWGSQGQI